MSVVLDDRLLRMSDDDLIREYETGMKYCFCRMFGKNQRRQQNAIADELFRRGVTHVPNIFGPIEIVNTWWD